MSRNIYVTKNIPDTAKKLRHAQSRQSIYVHAIHIFKYIYIYIKNKNDQESEKRVIYIYIQNIKQNKKREY